MTGIICINKPQDFTSFDVVAIMRRCFGTKKVGHGGTLDPMATGVLPVFVGGATKAVDIIPDSDKSYRGGFRLGLTSDTQDIWGALKQQGRSFASADELNEALSHFRGNIMQVPPMYSALKVNGQKLCDLARKGIEIEREPRPITVSRLEVVEFDGTDGILEVDCSSGTYIRTLIHDIGEALGTGAVMTSLCRTRACGFSLSQCYTIDEIREADRDTLQSRLLAVDEVFSPYRRVDLDEVQQRLYLNGVRLDAGRLSVKPDIGEPLRIYGNGVFFGLAKVNEDAELESLKRFPIE
ncbi:MAG: tRNA pseudouridine(55) synthase TruB [Oscillospiraceae bacterium]|nr:tRNA pseudouridine(55) synthase TruB [Oscillospiraceae bacterium]